MGVKDRLHAAWKALRKTDDYIGATIRPYEATVPNRMYERSFDTLSHKNSKYVKVCVTLRSQGVASLKWHVARRVKGGKQKVWNTKRMSDAALKSARVHSGPLAAKRFEMSDDYEIIADPTHPAVMLFEQVNGQMNGFDLFEQTEMMLCLTGNFYWLVVSGPNKWPTELWPMFPQFVTIKADRRDMVQSYLYGTGTENEIEIEPEQVVHFKRPNAVGDPLYGMGELASVLTEAELSAAFSEFALKFIDNGAQPGVIINIPGANPKQRQEIIAEFRRQAEGVRNASRSVVLSMPENAKIDVMQAATKEAGFLGGQSEEVVKKAICAGFGVPVGLVDMEDFSLANGQVAAPHFQMLTVLPAACRIADKINERIMPKFREAMGDESLVFYFENPVKGDVEKERASAVSLYTGGVLKLNEARSIVGADMDPSGDRYYVAPVASLTQTDAIDGEADPVAASGGSSGGSVQDEALNGAQVTALAELAAQVAQGQLPLESARAIAVAAFPFVDQATIDSVFNPLRSFTPELPPEAKAQAESQQSSDDEPPDEGDKLDEEVKAVRKPPLVIKVHGKSLRDLWLTGQGCGCKGCASTKNPRIDEPIAGEVTAVDAAVGLWLDALTLDVIQRLPRTMAELQSFDLFGGSVGPGALIQSTRGPLEAVAQSGVEVGFRDVGMSGPTLEVASERIRQFVDQAQKPFVRSVTDSVDAQIRAVLERAINEGMPTPDMVQQVAQVLGNNATNRASLIATTEAANIYNGAKELAWKDAGNVTRKEWLLSGNPCPVCVAIWEKKRYADLGEAFVQLGEVLQTTDGVWVNDYKPIMAPTAHPRCRCGMAPVTGGEQ